MSMALGDLLTTQEVAELLGVSGGRVRQFVMEGRLKPLDEKIGTALLFPRRTVELFAKRRIQKKK